MAKPPKKPSVAKSGDDVIEAYKRLLTYQFAGALAVVVILSLALGFSLRIAKIEPPLLILIMVCGMVGGIFSALTRLYNVGDARRPLLSPLVAKFGPLHLTVYSLIPPVVGAIAAVVVYVTFGAGVLTGVTFPEIVCKDPKNCADLYSMVHNFVPDEPADYAKALLWAFIAGFSERLVPDTLHTLAAKKGKPKGP